MTCSNDPSRRKRSRSQSSAPTTTSDEHIAVTIVEHVAAKKGVPPNTLEPIYEATKPDALDELFTAESGGSARTVRRVVFEYSGYEVTVTSDGDVHSTPLQDR